jgi:hypothetical protein
MINCDDGGDEQAENFFFRFSSVLKYKIEFSYYKEIK